MEIRWPLWIVTGPYPYVKLSKNALYNLHDLGNCRLIQIGRMEPSLKARRIPHVFLIPSALSADQFGLNLDL